MIGKLLTTALRKASRDVGAFDQDAQAAKSETEAFSFEPMIPLQPPAAQNDHPLHGYCQDIEADLRAAGYLR